MKEEIKIEISQIENKLNNKKALKDEDLEMLFLLSLVDESYAKNNSKKE